MSKKRIFKTAKMLIACICVVSLIKVFCFCHHELKDGYSLFNAHSPRIETKNSDIVVVKTKPQANKTTTLLPKRPKIKYIKTPPQLPKWELNECLSTQGKQSKMLIFVKSAGDNFIRRDVIRRTWASIKNVDQRSFRTIFIVGKIQNRTQLLLLNEEHKKYEDILQIDESDEYSHITMKTLAGMQWASENLSDEDYYSSSDDDMIINIKEVQRLVNHYRKVETNEKWTEFPIICVYAVLIPVAPRRNPNDKNYISWEMYKNEFFPLACLGGMYTSRVSLIKKLYDLSRNQTIFLNTDDVWITGILRQKLGIPDDMIVTALKNTAKHFGVVFENSPDNAIQNMLSEWKQNFN